MLTISRLNVKVSGRVLVRSSASETPLKWFTLNVCDFSLASVLILWTCRVGERLEEAVAACAEWGLVFDAVNDNLPERIATYGANPRKVNADEYWDDRAVVMDGI